MHSKKFKTIIDITICMYFLRNFLQDFLEILKRTLQNFKEILKKCFLRTYVLYYDNKYPSLNS